ncbi:hypothetical protein [Allokutzneria oryzae]|uniref:hypothetical protein n=1 Tax=Allokutzneria oryzae TaxID=1378989 RepID=UPI0036720F93
MIDAGAVPILWQSTAVDTVVRTSQPLYLGRAGDDGTVPGYFSGQGNKHSPVVLRCG